MPDGRQAWAIVVGINKYPTAAGQTVLKGAAADAADFADWALSKGGGDVAPERLFFWTHPAPSDPSAAVKAYLDGKQTVWCDGVAPDFARAPTSAEVVETGLTAARNGEIAAMDEQDKPIRRCYVFFAGHGVQTYGTAVQEPQTCFVLGNFRPNANLAGGLIPCEELLRALLALGFNEVVMFVDCCRTDVARLDMPVQGLSITQSKQPIRPIYVMGAASQMGEPAYETAAQPVRGAFSKTLVHGLRTVRGPQGELGFESLRNYVNMHIGAHSPKPQRPSFHGRPDNPWPLILHGGISAGTAPPLLAEIRIDLKGLPADAQIQVVDGFSAVVGGPLQPTDEIVVVPAPVDRLYSVEIVGTSRQVAFRLGPGGYDVRF